MREMGAQNPKPIYCSWRGSLTVPWALRSRLTVSRGYRLQGLRSEVGLGSATKALWNQRQATFLGPQFSHLANRRGSRQLLTVS